MPVESIIKCNIRLPDAKKPLFMRASEFVVMDTRTMRSVLVGFENGCNILKCRTLQKLTAVWDWE